MEASTCVSSQHWKGKSTDQSHFLHNEVDTLQAVELSASIDKHLPRSGSDRWITPMLSSLTTVALWTGMGEQLSGLMPIAVCTRTIVWPEHRMQMI